MLCAAAEAVGMTAAAAASRGSRALVGEPAGWGESALTIGLVTLGGIVEGTAVGLATHRGLRPVAPSLPKARWVTVTTLVAALGWAAGSAPATLASGAGSAGAAPPVLLVLAGAVGIGLVMGGILGAAQAMVLRGHAAHPGRWIVASVLAWAPAMAIIFAGASVPGEGWRSAAVIVVGTVTGLAAGAVLGLVLGLWAPALGRAGAPRVSRR